MRNFLKLLNKKTTFLMFVITCYLFFSMFTSFWKFFSIENEFSQKIIGISNTLLIIILFALMIFNFVNFICHADTIINQKQSTRVVTKKESLAAFTRNIVSLVPLIVLKLLKLVYEYHAKTVIFTVQQQIIILSAVMILILTALVSGYILLLYFQTSNCVITEETDSIGILTWFKNYHPKTINKHKIAIEEANIINFCCAIKLVLFIRRITIELIFKVRKTFHITLIKKMVIPFKNANLIK